MTNPPNIPALEEAARKAMEPVAEGSFMFAEATRSARRSQLALLATPETVLYLLSRLHAAEALAGAVKDFEMGERDFGHVRAALRAWEDAK